jgi:hypothetical protein
MNRSEWIDAILVAAVVVAGIYAWYLVLVVR